MKAETSGPIDPTSRLPAERSRPGTSFFSPHPSAFR